MPQSFPARLAYLQPVLQRLANTSHDDLFDPGSPAIGLVESVLSLRIAGLNSALAEQKLDRDLQELERWLDSNRMRTPATEFLRAGFLIVGGLTEEYLAPAADDASPSSDARRLVETEADTES